MPDLTEDQQFELEKLRLEKSLDAQAAAEADVRKSAEAVSADGRATKEAERAAVQEADLATIKASDDQELELSKLFHTTVTNTAVAGIERTRDSAKFVQQAASAILAVYTGLLGLVFSVTDHPLPFRGVYAGVFLGVSIALATAYLAFLTETPRLSVDWDRRSRPQMQISRTAWISRWITASVHSRRGALRGAVISLLFGVIFIAAPFVTPGHVSDPPPEVTAPQVPAQVAEGFEDEAKDLYARQLADYELALKDRTAALEQRTAEIQRQDQYTSLIEAISLLVAVLFVGVLLYSFGLGGASPQTQGRRP